MYRYEIIYLSIKTIAFMYSSIHNKNNRNKA